MITSSATQVVLGAGPAGTALARQLADLGHQVRIVSRSGGGPVHTHIERLAADIANLDAAVAATAGAESIYHAVNVPYHEQVALLPHLATMILAAARTHDARLVVLDTLYPYGEENGSNLTEDSPWAATSRKGRLRAALDVRYLDAHAQGEVRVVLGRAADFYGPGVLNSTLGGAFFPQALTGQPVLGLGDITLPHSYTYIGDVARGLAALGASDRGEGRVWHLPTVPAVSTTKIHEIVGELIGQSLDVEVMPEPVVREPFDEVFMNEYAEMFYQHRIPQNMVSAAFEREFGIAPTPLTEGLSATLAWYREFLATSR